MTQFFLTPDGAQLAYDVTGQGTPLLCLAGLTRNRSDFDDVLPHLGAVQVIRMDYRGRGESDWTGAATYTVEQEARDALALMDHLGLPQTAVLGTSRGGLVGMQMAVLAKHRLSGLCLNDIGPLIDRTAMQRIAGYVGRNPAAADLAGYALALAANPAFADVPPGRWLAQAARMAKVTPDGLRVNYDPALQQAFVDFMAGPDFWPQFGALQGLPLALIRGANTDLLSLDTVAAMQTRHPGLRVTSVPGRGHVPFLDEPESLTALHSFLKALT